MITFKIHKHDHKTTPVFPHVHQQQNSALLPAPHPYASHPLTYKFAKIPFSHYIERVKKEYSEGDFLVIRGTSYPYRQEDIWKIVNFQELYYNCAGNSPGQTPAPLYCRDKRGNTRWLAPDEVVKIRIEAYEF